MYCTLSNTTCSLDVVGSESVSARSHEPNLIQCDFDSSQTSNVSRVVLESSDSEPSKFWVDNIVDTSWFNICNRTNNPTNVMCSKVGLNHSEMYEFDIGGFDVSKFNELSNQTFQLTTTVRSSIFFVFCHSTYNIYFYSRMHRLYGGMANIFQMEL